jgi:hypothetical protein
MGVLHPFSLFLPYVHFVLGTVVVFMGRDDIGGQRKIGTLKNEHGCSFLSVGEVTAGSVETCSAVLERSLNLDQTRHTRGWGAGIPGIQNPQPVPQPQQTPGQNPRVSHTRDNP